MAEFSFTVTLADLDAGIAAMKSLARADRPGCCVLAQALRRETGTRAGVGLEFAHINNGAVELLMTDESRELVELFDTERYGELRSRLPLSLNLWRMA